nr:MAG TPA: hypothetical protein [Caudoviricetes sp.]
MSACRPRGARSGPRRPRAAAARISSPRASSTKGRPC